MKQSEITIAGKNVTIGYCYATEIGYKKMTGEDISTFIQDVLVCINSEPKRMPDVEKSLFLILAAMTAYYESVKKKSPVKDVDLMNTATPEELGKALGTILNLWTEFYNIPKGEPKDKQATEGGKKN